MNKKYLIIILVILIVIGLVVYFMRQGVQTPIQTAPSQNQAAVTTATPATPAQSLGGQIYNQSKNPLQNNLPDVNPVKNANPIQGININPF